MKRYCITVVLLFFLFNIYSQVKTIDLRSKVNSLHLVEGKNIVEKSNNGYQLILEKSGNLKTWKIISPTGVESILTPEINHSNEAEKKKGTGPKSTGYQRPSSCTICYKYPVDAGEMEICYEIPCP
jgi:hypothetical protein